MKKHNDPFEINIAHLVKLTRDTQRPSKAFIEQLQNNALRELMSPESTPVREGDLSTMKKIWIIRTACAAAVILVSIVFVNQYQSSPSKHHVAIPTLPRSTSSPKTVNGMEPIPLVLPRPTFAGTPTNWEGVSHLEKPRGKSRPAFLAPVGVKNVALNKQVISSVESPILGELAWLTDGDKEANDGSLVELDPFAQHVTVDLEDESEIYAIVFWHYHKQARVYFDVIVQTSNDPDFIEGVTTHFNNDIDNSCGLGVGQDRHYIETNEGRLVDAQGIRARYVRLYSNGSNASDVNHYLEIEVFGRPVESKK